MAAPQNFLTSLTRTLTFPLLKVYFFLEILFFFTKIWFLSNPKKFFDFAYLNPNFSPSKSVFFLRKLVFSHKNMVFKQRPKVF